MHRSDLGILAPFSTLLLLTLIFACSSGSSGGQGSPKPGSGGSGTGGNNGGRGGSSGSGGNAGSGGARAGTGGSSGSGGTSAGSGGVRAGTGGSPGSGGTSAGSGGNAGSGGSTGSGGNAGSGGSTNSGGSTGSGGSTNRGGSTNSGGGAGSGGGTGRGGASGGTGGTTGGSSSFAVKVELSTAIPTVGIATWSLDAPIDSATIDFGRDQSDFELQAPVDLNADNHRTLLLGMKQNTTYYVRVTASGGGQTHMSQVASIKTGSLPSGLPVAKVTDHDASALYAGGGFTVSCMGWATTGGSGGPTDAGSTGSWAFILDPGGDMVWGYDLSKTVSPQCTRARMSLDGKYMWANNFGNTTPDGALTRIAMDGLGTPGAYSLPGSTHDFAILPDDHVVYIARDNGGSGMQPESLFELDPSTSQTKLIYSETKDFGDLFDTRGGHTNQVNYIPELKAISFSMYFINTIGLVSYPEAKLLAAFGGSHSTFSTMNWTGQHGHDVFQDHIVLFNNENTNGALIRRFEYNLQAKTATEDSGYSCGLSSRALGDVKEMPNGNYFVTYSMIGTMHEINSSLKLLREIETNASIAYAEHRASLYGPPPPYVR